MDRDATLSPELGEDEFGARFWAVSLLRRRSPMRIGQEVFEIGLGCWSLGSRKPVRNLNQDLRQARNGHSAQIRDGFFSVIELAQHPAEHTYWGA